MTKKKATPKKLKIPPPAHRLGYSDAQLKSFLTPKQYTDFCKAFGVGTVAVDDGIIYIYEHDVVRFLNLVLYGIPTYWD